MRTSVWGKRKMDYGFKLWNSSRPCSPIVTMGQVNWFSWKTPLSKYHPVPPNIKTPLSQSHPVPPNLKTPLSQSHLADILQPHPTCPIWLYHLFFPNSLFSDLFLVSHCHFTFWKMLVGTRLLILGTNLRRRCTWFRDFIIAYVRRDAKMGWVSLIVFLPNLVSIFLILFRQSFGKENRFLKTDLWWGRPSFETDF